MAPRFRTDGPAARPHVPPPGDSALGHFKEWWHFNLIDDASGLDALVNFSFGGDLFQPGGGEANLIILAHLPESGWIGGIDSFDGLAARLELEAVDIAIGQSSISCEADCYRLHLHRADGSVFADLVFEPQAEPLTVWKNTPLGDGHINWMLAPSMVVRGRFQLNERTIELAGARGYHDHNWGAWQWGEFGWVWGFCSAGGDAEGQGGGDSLVYNASLGRGGTQVFEQSLLIWRGERLAKLFLREHIRSNSRGRFVRPVRRIPGAMNLIDHSRVTSVPRTIEMSARDGADWVEARYEPDTAIQIAIPKETGFGLIELNETLGTLVAEGEVAGRAIRISRRACFEFVG